MLQIENSPKSRAVMRSTIYIHCAISVFVAEVHTTLAEAMNTCKTLAGNACNAGGECVCVRTWYISGMYLGWSQAKYYYKIVVKVMHSLGSQTVAVPILAGKQQ